MMSHTAACNTTVSTKNTRPTLVKFVRNLCITLHACKGNASENVQEIKRGHGYEYVCLLSSRYSVPEMYASVMHARKPGI